MERDPISKSVICPYIGLHDDPDTSVSYPSENNYCHCSATIEPISLDHQQTFCLGAAYQGCPILSKKTEVAPQRSNLLSQLNAILPGANHKWRRTAVAGIVLIAIVGVLLIQTLRVASQQVVELSSTATVITDTRGTLTRTSLPVIASPINTQGTLTRTPTVVASKTKQATPTVPSPIPSFANAYTATIQPSATLTPSATNPNSFRLILHQVVAGDSLSLIAMQFHTTQEAIQTINFNFRAPLQQDAWVIVPANTSDVRGLPQFEIIVNSQPDITLKELALKLQINSELLAQYNELKPDDKLKAGQRIMAPKTIAK